MNIKLSTLLKIKHLTPQLEMYTFLCFNYQNGNLLFILESKRDKILVTKKRQDFMKKYLNLHNNIIFK